MKIEASKSIKELSKFLPEELKQKIFNQVLEKQGAEKRLAETLGVNVFVINAWKKNGKIKEELFPSILALALQVCPETKEMIKGHALNELKELCLDLNILEEQKRDKVKDFLDLLDAESKKIVFYVSRKGHARISELTKLLLTGNDTLTLNKIREIINPAAKNVFGKPFMAFKEAEIEQINGKKVLFSWWVEQETQIIQKQETDLFEIFDEKDFVRITAELHGIKENEVEVELNNENLLIYAKTPHANLRKRIPLYVPIEKVIEKTYRNGILEVKLVKRK